jgi:hypothetical protein
MRILISSIAFAAAPRRFGIDVALPVGAGIAG